MKIFATEARPVRRLVVGSVVALVAVLVGSVGSYVLASQRAAEDRLRQDFAARAAIAAGSTGGAMRASEDQNRAWARAALTGPAAGIPAILAGQHGTLDGLAVLSADGTVLGADPVSFRSTAGDIGRSSSFTEHLTGGGPAFGDILPSTGTIAAFLVYPAGADTRVLLLSVPLQLIASFTEPALVNSLGSVKGSAFILDSNDRTILAGGEAAGGPTAGTPIARAAPGTADGRIAGTYFASSPVPNTQWHLVLTAPETRLLAPLQPARRVGWQLFAGFVVAVVLLLVIGGLALGGAVRVARSRLYDNLTGLPNRTLFRQHLEAALRKWQRHGSLFGVLFIDLDGFKPVNDAFGHAGGDTLLREVAKRLGGCIRPGDTVARFGGDEFVVLCHEIRDRQHALDIATRVRAAISEPIEIAGEFVSIGASAGVALPDRSTSADELLHRADLAMYDAKRQNRSPRPAGARPAAGQSVTG